MKNKACIILMIVLLLVSGFQASAEIQQSFEHAVEPVLSTVNYAPESHRLVISGEGWKKDDIVSVLILETAEGVKNHTDITSENIASYLYNIVQLHANADGEYVYEILLPELKGEDVVGKEYVVEIGCRRLEQNFLAKVYNASEEELDECINAFSNADEAAAEMLLNTYSCYSESATKPILNVDITNTDFLTYKNDILLTFVSQKETDFPDGFDSLQQIENIFVTTMGVNALNTAESQDRVSVIEQYNNIFMLDLENEIYESNFAEICELMYEQSEAAEGRLSNVSAIRSAFDKALVVKEINSATRTEIGELLEKYTTYFEVDYKNSAKSEVLKDLWKKDFKTPEEIMEAFNESVEDNSPSSSKGGSSKGSSSVSVPSKVTISDEKTINSTKQAGFEDLQGFDWAKESICALYDKKIISGYDEKTFMPSAVVKKEEFVKMIVLAFDIKTAEAEDKFTDVDGSSWYAPFVYGAHQGGIVNGQSDDLFGIGEGLSREDAACILYRAIGENELGSVENNTVFVDAEDIAPYAQEAVAALVSKGIISGKDDGNFAPKDKITRAETAKLIYFALNGLK